MDAVNVISYIVAAYFGIIIGNFATSFYFRIPRNISLFGLKHINSVSPQCSKCNHYLKLKEYLPIIGFISCKGRCNYCGNKIDICYLIIEIFSLLLSLICYYYFYFLDWYIIFLLFGIVSSIMSLSLYNNINVSFKFIFFSIFLSIIYDTLLNLTIYDWVFKVAISSILYSLYINFSYKYNFKNLDLELIKIILVSFFWFDLLFIIPYTMLLVASYFLYVNLKVMLVRHFYFASYVLIFLTILINHLMRL